MLKAFYIFIIYSILGWLMGVVIVSTKKRKITDRGFLIGPWCPIYGFGALGLILVYVFNPFFLRIVKNISPIIFNIIMVIILLIFIIDVVTSFKIIYNLRKESYINVKDITETTTEEVKKALREKSIFNRRLLNSFPHLKFIFKQKKTIQITLFIKNIKRCAIIKL